MAEHASSSSSSSFPPAAVDVVVMAAGQGTRMKSAKPKVLHRLAGRALISHVLERAGGLLPRKLIVVTGHGADAVETHIRAEPQGAAVVFVRQMPQHGTGHAVQQAVPALGEGGMALVLNGDVPLIEVATLAALLEAAGGDKLALLTVRLQDPTGYGRILRDAGGGVTAIVEHKDATEAQRATREIYTGVMAAPVALLKTCLAKLTDDNAQREYYLTDVVAHARAAGAEVVALTTDDPVQVEGVNSPVQLAALERAHQLRLARALMDGGTRLADPARIDVRGALECGRDVEIDVNCVFAGRVTLGEGVRIGANCVLADADIEAGATIHAFTHIDGGGKDGRVVVGAGAVVGPYARLRPGATLGAEVHIGNFVEVKNARLAEGAKANHLAYLGDADVGARVNVGAGSITANYDGANKHRTVIEDDAHIGSNSVLVAPLVIGAGGTVGAGSVVTKDTPAGALTVVRGKAVSVAGWKRPARKR